MTEGKPVTSEDQAKREPLPASPEEGSGTEATERNEELGSRRNVSAAPTDPVPTPGEPDGAMWPGVHAARAESEEGEVTRVEDTALAPPGKPDGEVDTRA